VTTSIKHGDPGVFQVVDISTEVDRAFDSSAELLLLSIPSLNTTHSEGMKNASARLPEPDTVDLLPIDTNIQNHNSIGAQSSQGHAHRRKAPN
jgi:hypothetical protein